MPEDFPPQGHSPAPHSLDTHHPPEDQPTEDSRRGFLRWVTHGLGAIFAVILGFPALMYLIDPRNRAARQKDMRPVEGINLGDIQVDHPPRQGIIRDVRRDAWTLHPSDVIGRVWVVKHGPARDDFHVFTTVCPHLGCSVNLNTDAGKAIGFLCPCHNGQFDLDGEKVEVAGVNNPAPRGMDKLVWQRDRNDPNRLLVNYVNFKPMESTPIERT